MRLWVDNYQTAEKDGFLYEGYIGIDEDVVLAQHEVGESDIPLGVQVDVGFTDPEQNTELSPTYEMMESIFTKIGFE